MKLKGALSYAIFYTLLNQEYPAVVAITNANNEMLHKQIKLRSIVL